MNIYNYDRAEKIAKLSIRFFERSLAKITKLTKFVIFASRKYRDKVLEKPFYKKFRYLSWPWHHVLIRIYIWLRRSEQKPVLFDEEGVQIISGNTGSGKTSLTYSIIERLRALHGKPSLINTQFEKPRTDEKSGVKYVYHKVFNFTDYWSNYKMHFLPDHRKYASIVIDEIQYELDYRMTMTKEYKAKFNPFRDYAVLIRHHIKRLYATTQMERVDKMLMQLAKYYHVVRVDIGFDYHDWLVETGAFRFTILGWYVDSYKVDGIKDEKHLYKSWYFKNEHANFDYYDTYSMSGAFDHLEFGK